jgi:hypothetical protein
VDDFDPDAYLAKRKAASPAAFDPDAYLAKRAQASAGPAPIPPGVPRFLPANLPTPNLSLKDQRGYVPEKRARAVFPDIGQSMTGEELAAIQPDRETQQKAAFLGGALQGGTLGYADELAALAKTSPVHLALSPATAALSAHGNPEYTKERNENRSAFRTAQEWDPKKYAEGELTGAATTMPLTAGMGLGPTAAKPLLSMANTGRAALGGVVEGIGSSEAEDAGGIIRDATLGAGAGVAANTALGLLGKGAKGVRSYVANAPARAAAKADEALIDAITLGAPAGQRDALMGELGRDRADILTMVRRNPEFEAAILAGDKERAVGILRQTQATMAQEDAAAVSGLQLQHGKVKATPVVSSLEEMQARAAANPSVESQAQAAALQKQIDATKAAWAPEVEPAWASNRKVAARPLVEALENYRDRLAANPSTESQALVAKLQKRIDAIKEKWIPAEKPPEPKGPELLGKLMEGADSGDKQRAGSHAEQFLKIAEQNKLGKVAHEPEQLLTKIDATLETMNKRADAIYGRVGSGSTSNRRSYPSIPERDLSAAISTELASLKPGEELALRGDDVAPMLRFRRSRYRPDDGGRQSLEPGTSTIAITKNGQLLNDWSIDPNKGWNQAFYRNPRNYGERIFLIRGKPVGAGRDKHAGEILMGGDHKIVAEIGGASSEPAGNIYVANVSGKLREWADRLRKEPGGMRLKDADNVDAIAANISQAASNSGKNTMTPRELRQLITNVQGKAFSGSYLDPTEAKSMQRELSAQFRGLLDEHVAKHGSAADLKNLNMLNERISALITFRDAAEKRAIAQRMTAPAAPETRTGWAPPEEAAELARTTEDPEAKRLLVEGLSKQLGAPTVPPGLGEVKIRDIREMANSIKDPDVRRAVTGALYEQIGPEASHTLAGLDRQAELANRLEAPLVHTGTREASPPTTLRHHAGSIVHGIKTTGAHTLAAAALTASALGHHGISAISLAAAAAAKYGPEAGKIVERAATAMEIAARRYKANDAHLMAIAKMAGVPADMAADLVAATAPRAAANAVTAGRGE